MVLTKNKAYANIEPGKIKTKTMNEQYAGPSHPNPELVDLHKSDIILVDTNQPIYDASEIGLPTQHQNQYFGVVAELELQAGDEGEQPRIAIIRTDNAYNHATEFFAVGLTTDKDGTRSIIPGVSWNKLEKGHEVTVGRSPGENGIYSSKLGLNLSDGVSRKHLTLEVGEDGLLISDVSSNGTRALAVVKSNERTGSQELTNEAPKIPLIDSIPLDNEALMEIQAKEEAIREAEYRERLDAIHTEMDALRADLSEDDKLALWKYASGILNKSDAQVRGDGQESRNQESIAGEGIRDMTPSAATKKDKYLALMRQSSELLASNRK